MKVVLLSAGLGKRLEPITYSIPKPMIPISGKPILGYIIDDLKKLGFTDFCIVIGHLGEKIKQYFGDGTNFNVKISYVEQEIFSGTATATKLAKNFVNDSPFLLYLADTIIPKNLRNYIQNMINSNFEINLLSSQINSSEIGNVGNIEVKNECVSKISEKTLSSKSNLAWAGIAFFKNNYIFKMIEQLSPSQRGEFEITDAMNLVLENNVKIGNFTCDGYIDAGTISGLLELNTFILNLQQRTTQNSSNIHYPVYIGNQCTIGKNVELGPSVSIGDGVNIGDNVKIKNSLIFNNSKISSNQNISNSIIDDNQNILSL
ncbi:sugar phosphate nucleotidyltransferase [Nitrosopumilus sp.]|nr:sugar phosphate nucleotidyltransferase [Nitrosopumilus sp.]